MSLGHLQQICSSGIRLCWQLRYLLAAYIILIPLWESCGRLDTGRWTRATTPCRRHARSKHVSMGIRWLGYNHDLRQ